MKEIQKTEHIEITLQECRYCKINEPYIISIESIKAQENSWIAQGKGRTDIPCRRCGSLYTAIMNRIPIECKPFKCPKCEKVEKLNYKINNISTDNESFEFEVEIYCKKCKNKKSFKKIITQIFNLIKIQINPSGVSISKS